MHILEYLWLATSTMICASLLLIDASPVIARQINAKQRFSKVSSWPYYCQYLSASYKAKFLLSIVLINIIWVFLLLFSHLVQ